MQALGDKKVLLIGVGGVGSHVAAALCRAGIGQLEIVDFDVVDESNLGRQYYDVNDVGVVKVEAMMFLLFFFFNQSKLYSHRS